MTNRLLATHAVALDPLVNNPVRYPGLICPLTDSHGATEGGDANGIPAVVVLLKTGRPFAIVGFVVSKIVVAIKSVIRRRPVLHIGGKINNVFSPPVTNFNPASAVMLKHRVTRVVAAPNHAIPYLEQRMLRHAVSRSSLVARDGKLSIKAPAGLCIPAPQIACNGHRFLAAITRALPGGAPIINFFGEATDHSQSRKPLANQIQCILRFLHGGIMPMTTSPVNEANNGIE